jgi:hypothetical protein
MPKAQFLKNKDHIPGEYCLISYEKFNENDYTNNRVIKLKCGHKFMDQNITESYKITNCSGRNYIGKRICPYCRKSGGYLPYNGSNAIRGIHNLNAVKAWRLKLIEDKQKKSGYNTCCAILVCGIHRGYPCGSFVKNPKNPYIYKCTIKKDGDQTTDHFVFKKLNWCGKHKRAKQKFQDMNYDIKNFSKKLIPSEYLKLFEITQNEHIYKLYISSNNYDNFLNVTETLSHPLLQPSLSVDFINNIKKKFINKLKL